MPLSTHANPPPLYIRTPLPKLYQKQPIISRLIRRYDLTINIPAAMLGIHSRNDGWLDLELQGSLQQREAGLTYLKELNYRDFSTYSQKPFGNKDKKSSAFRHHQ